MLDQYIADCIGAKLPLTREALEAWQLNELNKTIALAKECSSFYREHLKGFGPGSPGKSDSQGKSDSPSKSDSPGRLTSLDELAGLPFVTPEDIREHGSRMLCIPPRDVARIVSQLPRDDTDPASPADCLHEPYITQLTSGSAGLPKRIAFSAGDIERTIDYFKHGLSEFVQPGERVLILFPEGGPNGLNDLIIKALKRISADSASANGNAAGNTSDSSVDIACAAATSGAVFGYPTRERMDELLDRIINDRITFLIGTAAAMEAAARYSEEAGRAGKIAEQIRGVLAAAAFVSENDRHDVMRIWQCGFNEHYSMTETGYAGAVGCAVPGGYHVWESGLIYEIVDPATGLPCPDGEPGEIVVTTLGPRAMPLIRYRTGDISRIVPGQCPCGSCLKRLGRVHERPARKKFER